MFEIKLCNTDTILVTAKTGNEAMNKAIKDFNITYEDIETVFKIF